MTNGKSFKINSRRILQFLSENKSIVLFLLKLFSLLIVWLILESSNVLNSSGLNNGIISNLVFFSEWLLQSLGYDVFSDSDIVGITGTSGVLIGAPCNALDLMALFLGILILLPGKILFKLLFALAGMFVIHILNLIRVIALILILKSSPELLEFNHNYTFTLIMYVLIFFGWVLWIRLGVGQKDE